MGRDAAGFDEFYYATSGRVLRYGYAVTGDAGLARELVQDAYTSAWREWRRVSRHPAPEVWVRGTVARLAPERDRPLRNPAGADAVPGFVQALRRLPVGQRQALALHHLYGLGVAEIARETGVPDGTVASWLSRGSAALAAHLMLEVHDVD
jgi:RNA polymerase sigma-70 factor (ECF subfamily)